MFDDGQLQERARVHFEAHLQRAREYALELGTLQTRAEVVDCALSVASVLCKAQDEISSLGSYELARVARTAHAECLSFCRDALVSRLETL